mgnify:CR=1 FL=1
MGHRPGHHGRDHHARRAEHETEVFEEPGQAVQNAQAGATLEKSDVEKVATPERIRSDLLDDLLGRILLLDRVGRSILATLFLNDFNHPLEQQLELDAEFNGAR